MRTGKAVNDGEPEIELTCAQCCRMLYFEVKLDEF